LGALQLPVRLVVQLFRGVNDSVNHFRSGLLVGYGRWYNGKKRE